MADFASIPFFEATGISGDQTVYSSVFDVAAYGNVVTALKVIAIGGNTPALDATIQQSMDMDQWDQKVSFSQAGSASLEIKNTDTPPARYVRAMVTTASASPDVTVTFSLLGIARDLG